MSLPVILTAQFSDIRQVQLCCITMVLLQKF